MLLCQMSAYLQGVSTATLVQAWQKLLLNSYKCGLNEANDIYDLERQLASWIIIDFCIENNQGASVIMWLNGASSALVLIDGLITT